MTYTYPSPKDTREIQNAIVAFLETNLIDPYEQRTSKTRTNFVYGKDFELVGTWPKIHVSVAGYKPQNVAGQGRTDYLEEEEHSFAIYYYTQRNKRFNFSDNGLTLINEAQIMKYLQYLKKTMKTNMNTFNTYFHKPTFGSISKPKWDPETNCFRGMIPLVAYTYVR